MNFRTSFYHVAVVFKTDSHIKLSKCTCTLISIELALRRLHCGTDRKMCTRCVSNGKKVVTILYVRVEKRVLHIPCPIMQMGNPFRIEVVSCLFCIENYVLQNKITQFYMETRPFEQEHCIYVCVGLWVWVWVGVRGQRSASRLMSGVCMCA